MVVSHAYLSALPGDGERLWDLHARETSADGAAFAAPQEVDAAPHGRAGCTADLLPSRWGFPCRGEVATIVGTDKDEVIIGTDGADVIVALGSADTIRSIQGADIVCAGAGNDRVHGGKGSDEFEGGNAADACCRRQGSGPTRHYLSMRGRHEVKARRGHE